MKTQSAIIAQEEAWAIRRMGAIAKITQSYSEDSQRVYEVIRK